MKYSVTYCVQDQEAGSNPGWHSLIMLNEMNEAKKMLQVVETWGFYGLPTTGDQNSWITKLKIKIGLNVDLYGNHGMLRHEDTRFMDLGRGLHGMTFELSQAQFEALKKYCQDIAEKQKKAIKDIVDTLGLSPKSPEKTKIYPHEHHSFLIYQIEKIKAQQEGREPYLKPFELNFKLGLWCPELSLNYKTQLFSFVSRLSRTSFNCKTQAVALLETVLSKEQIAHLTENGNHPTLPRRSGLNEELFVFSEGRLRQHKKASGKMVHNRDESDPNLSLWFTLPPQMIYGSEDTVALLHIDKKYYSAIKSVVKKLQRLEWFLYDSEVPSEYQAYKEQLIQRVIETYKTFAVIEPKENEKPHVHGLRGYLNRFFSKPQDKLQQHLEEAKQLLNSLYFAVVDGWTIDNSSPKEPSEMRASEKKRKQVHASRTEEECEGLVETTSCGNQDEDHPASDVFCDADPIEAVVYYLSTADKKTLCHILGRSYSEPEQDLKKSDDELDDFEDVYLSSTELQALG